MVAGQMAMLEEQIDRWPGYLRRRQTIHSTDIAEPEDHLREQIAVLTDAGLAVEEAFLVAVRRMGNLDAVSRERAREHTERLWKQLVAYPSVSARDPHSPPPRRIRCDAGPAGGRCAIGRRGRGSFLELERWQTGYLPAYAVWAAIVVIAFPPVFGGI